MVNDAATREIDSPPETALTEQGAAARGWLVAHIATLVLAAVVLAWANRNQWFFGDEWEFLLNRGFVDYRLNIWIPHNEHWSTVPIAVYTALRDTFGLGSYWPYISVLVVLHLLLVHLLWRVMMRAGVTPVIATTAALVFALFGAGAENMLWAFQIGFVGSLAAGWAAALVVDRSDKLTRRDGWAVALLVVSLMCSGIGIPAVALVTLIALARARNLLRPLVVGGVPTAVFLLWYLVVPQNPSPPWQSPSDDGVFALVKHVAKGLRNTIAASTGLPPMLALVLVGLAVAWAAYLGVIIALRRPGAADWAAPLGGMCAAAGFFLLSGFGRADTGSSRYFYVAIALALPGLALGLSRLARWPWLQGLVVIGLIAVLVVNLRILHDRWVSEASQEAAIRQTVEAAARLAENGEAFVQGRPDPAFSPDITVADLPGMVDEGLNADAATADRTATARLTVQVDTTPTTTDPAAAPPSLQGSANVTVEDLLSPAADTRCVRLTTTAGDPHAILSAPGGLSELSVFAPDQGAFSIRLEDALDAGQALQQTAPDETRFVRTSFPAGTPFRLTLALPYADVCGLR